MSRSGLVRIEFVNDGDFGVVELVAREDAVFAIDLEEGDRDHQRVGEVEGMVLGEGEIV